MANERSGLFSEDKKKWREVYLNNLLRVIFNDDEAVKSLVARGSIKKSEKKANEENPRDVDIVADDLNHALIAIDKSGESQYSIIDPHRVPAVLLKAGFTHSEIDQMRKSFQLTVDAAIFYAKDHDLLYTKKDDQMFLGPIEERYNILGNPDSLLLKDKLDFTNKELTQLGSPLIKFQFTKQFIDDRLKNIDEHREEYKALTELKGGLQQLEKVLCSKIPITELDFENFNREYQSLLSRTKDLLFTANPQLKEAPAYSLIFSSIKPRSGLELLTDTFNSNTANTKALGRTLLAMDCGKLTVNGQEPDENYPLGEYLIHGGRVKFDVSKLSAAEQEDFFKFITVEQAQKRAFATHRSGGTDANGSPAEMKSGFFGAIADTFLAIAGKSKHHGINLAIGGNNVPSREGSHNYFGKIPEENGEWGHMYLHKDENLVLIGIEPSAPGKTNLRTGQAHSKTGSAGELSPFLARKIDSEALHQEQRIAGKTPLSTREKNNWATITVTSDQFLKMKKRAEESERHPVPVEMEYSLLVGKKPVDAVKPSETRLNDMQAWAKATKQGNKVSTIARAAGLFFVVVGFILMFVPLPVVAQALGGAVVTLGIGIGAGVLGAALFAGGSYTSSSKAEKLYNKSRTVPEVYSAQNTNSLIIQPNQDRDNALRTPLLINDQGKENNKPKLERVETNSSPIFVDPEHFVGNSNKELEKNARRQEQIESEPMLQSVKNRSNNSTAVTASSHTAFIKEQVQNIRNEQVQKKEKDPNLDLLTPDQSIQGPK